MAISQPQPPASARHEQNDANPSERARQPNELPQHEESYDCISALTTSAIGICRKTALSCAARISSRISSGSALRLKKPRISHPKSTRGMRQRCGGATEPQAVPRWSRDISRCRPPGERQLRVLFFRSIDDQLTVEGSRPSRTPATRTETARHRYSVPRGAPRSADAAPATELPDATDQLGPTV